MSWTPIAQEPKVAVIFEVEAGKLKRITMQNAKDFRMQILGDERGEEKIAAWCRVYAAGQTKKFPLPLDWQGISPFRLKVLQELARVPFAKTLQYKELAAKAQNPRASRAAGSACAQNPFPLVVPCHRVLSSSGLGGFAFGLPMKQMLLDFEASFTEK